MLCPVFHLQGWIFAKEEHNEKNYQVVARQNRIFAVQLPTVHEAIAIDYLVYVTMKNLQLELDK